MKNIICFGDSNTYGYDPRSWYGGRYDPDSRWVDILAREIGRTVRNLGENGRTIPSAPIAVPPDTHLLIVMLGTNDLLQGRSPEASAVKLNHFLASLNFRKTDILLIAPPPLTLGTWVPDQQLVDNSRIFARCCETLANQLGIQFADAGKWGISLAHDGVHFSPQGHRAFAAGLYALITAVSKEVPT